MKNKTIDLFEVNSDILALFAVTNEVGWKDIREQSIHRILYLSSVLYSFVNGSGKNIFNRYHFSLTISGPYSEIISRSLIDLQTRGIITENDSDLRIDFKVMVDGNFPTSNNIEWFRTVIYVLGLYGENKIFGFIIQDPQYKNDFQRNSQLEIDISDQNKTIQALNAFKKAFEETLKDVSQISEKEYLELYFEYIFSRIIKREN